MADPKPDYRFRFQIIDQVTGEVVETDFTYITDIDQFGNCESVDIHVGSMLRNFKRSGRAAYEAKEYPEPETEEEAA